MENNKSRWVQLIQQIITLLFLPWAAWITATIMAHSIALAELKQWQDNRPKFVTSEQLSISILNNEKEMREKLNTKLDMILEKINALDRRMSEHLAETRKP